jgi:rhodanese-related sulfurtransferase
MVGSRKHLLIVLLAIAAMALAACGSGGPPADAISATPGVEAQRVMADSGGTYIDVDAAGLAALLEDKDFTMVNVHIPYVGEIAGTDLFVPYDEIDSRLDKLPADKGAKLVVYCRSGGMSALAARDLVSLGYTDVWNLAGGMVAWRQVGHPLEDRDGRG